MLPVGLRQGGDVAGGRPMSETLERRPQANQRYSETSLSEASDEVGIWAGLLTRLARGPARGSFSSFLLC
jgi:hypothetical protein